MNYRILSLVAAFSILVSPVAAQTQLDVGPGTIGPSSPIYGLEVAWDNAMVSVGLKTAGRVVQERAVEARQAAENGNYQAAQKAAENAADIAKKAKSGDVQGLEKAEAVLQEVIANAPPEAQQGLRTAINNVRQQRDRATGTGQQPDENVPDQGDQQQQPETGQQGQNQTSETQQAKAVEVVSGVTPDRTIDATNYEFSKSSISVSKGSVVRFVNQEGSHTVTLDTAGIDRTLSGSESVTLRFNEGGTFQIYCRFHGSTGSGMHTDVAVG